MATVSRPIATTAINNAPEKQRAKQQQQQQQQQQPEKAAEAKARRANLLAQRVTNP
jgi:hypothetical protein